MKRAVCLSFAASSVAILFGLGPAWADTPPQDRADRVWAAGYAAAAAHFCPGVQVNDAAVARTHGAATVIDPKTGPMLDDAMLPMFKSGGLAGESEFRQHTDFCSDPSLSAQRASSWVRRYLVLQSHRR